MFAERHQHQVGARFSAAAQTYTHASQLQDRVAKRVLDLIPPGFTPRTVLDAGCGTGRLMHLARRRWPETRLVGVDIAPGMIRQARDSALDARMQFVEADLGHFHAETEFDLVLSSSSLHWLRPFGRGFVRVASCCRRDGLAAFGIMMDGTLAELHEAKKAAAPDVVNTARLPGFDDLEKAARAIPGARIRRIEQIKAEYDHPSARDLLVNLHAMGVTGGDVSRGSRPLRRKELAALAEWYDQHYATPNGIRVTFHVGYVLLEF